MSHEIRTPLHGILGMTELALTNELAAGPRECLQAVLTSANSLLEIINDILDLSKIEAGRLELEFERFSLMSALHDVLQIQSVHADERDLELVCDVAYDVPDFLHGDCLRLRQILTNLVGNAIKFTPRGGVYVTIRLTGRNDDEKKCWIDFSVRDTGVGISREAQGRIFDAFSQGDSSTARKFGGTGLGLSICHRLIQHLGGEFTVTSELGKGSTFRFVLPFVHDATIGDQPLMCAAGKRTVVLAASEPLRDVLVSYLESAGCKMITPKQATTSYDDEWFHETLAGGQIDLVIVDDGILHTISQGASWTQWFTSQSSSRPAMALLQRQVPRSSIHVDPTWFDHHLTKPVMPTDIRDLLHRLFYVDQPQDESGRGKQTAPIQSLRVLVAEDNRINQRLVTLILQGRGHHVDIVSSGADALQQLKQVRYDACLMDCQMPIMDGYETVAAVRAWEAAEQRDRLPVIALTASAMQGDRERCLAAGMDAYLTKPFQPDQLIVMLENLGEIDR